MGRRSEGVESAGVKRFGSFSGSGGMIILANGSVVAVGAFQAAVASNKELDYLGELLTKTRCHGHGGMKRSMPKTCHASAFSPSIGPVGCVDFKVQYDGEVERDYRRPVMSAAEGCIQEML